MSTCNFCADCFGRQLLWRVIEEDGTLKEISNYLPFPSFSDLAPTTLRRVLGQMEPDELQSERERLNRKLREVMYQKTETFGVTVSSVETVKGTIPGRGSPAAARPGG